MPGAQAWAAARRVKVFTENATSVKWIMCGRLANHPVFVFAGECARFRAAFGFEPARVAVFRAAGGTVPLSTDFACTMPEKKYREHRSPMRTSG